MLLNAIILLTTLLLNQDAADYAKNLWELSPLIGAICTPLVLLISYLVIEARSSTKKHDDRMAEMRTHYESRVDDLKDRIKEKDNILLRVYDERRDDERHTLEVLINLNALTKQIIVSGKEQADRVLVAIATLDRSINDFKNALNNRG